MGTNNEMLGVTCVGFMDFYATLCDFWIEWILCFYH